MRSAGKYSFFIFMLLAAFAAQSAYATLEYLLPESSHYSGSTYYDIEIDDGYLRGRIDFAVYDTQTYENEFIGDDGYENPGDGRYIYVYQIFNNYSASDKEVAFFALLDIMGDPISETGAPISGTGSVDDGSGGVQPSDSTEEGVWVFENGVIFSDGHSYFLVLSSDTDWVAGNYEIKHADDDFPVPNVPEPASIVILGAGFLSLLRRRPTRI